MCAGPATAAQHGRDCGMAARRPRGWREGGGTGEGAPAAWPRDDHEDRVVQELSAIGFARIRDGSDRR